MPRPRLIATFALWLSLPAAAGVDLGGNLPMKAQRASAVSLASLKLRGAIKEVRWIRQSGHTVSRTVCLPLGDELLLVAPAGTWTDVELVFDGPPSVDGRAIPLTTLVLALDEPLTTEGEPVALYLDVSALEGLRPGELSARELAQALVDGIGLRSER